MALPVLEIEEQGFAHAIQLELEDSPVMKNTISAPVTPPFLYAEGVLNPQTELE